MRPLKSFPVFISAVPLCRVPCSRRHASGFSLIELLTVIAICSILLAITIPAVTKVRHLADDAQCKTSLRQWGTAMQLYIQDHDGRLPGRCTVVVDRRLNNVPESLHGHLFQFLAPYASLKNSDTELVPDGYICRAWVNDSPVRNGSVYMTRMPEHRTIELPYGYGNKMPMQYKDVLEMEHVEEMVALVELDDALLADDYSQKAPRHPVHGSHRNALHWDWHIGTKPVAP